jgi:hypothetical protein
VSANLLRALRIGVHIVVGAMALSGCGGNSGGNSPAVTPLSSSSGSSTSGSSTSGSSTSGSSTSGSSTSGSSSGTGSSGGAVAPTLLTPTPSGTLGTTTTATLGATTNQSSGALYGVVDTAANLSGVTAAQIESGSNSEGTAAFAAVTATVSTTAPNAAVSGLAAGTAYSYAEVQTNSNGTSNIISGTFTTASIPPATLSSPTPSGTLSTSATATLGVTTIQGSGTLYGVVDTAANLSGVTAAQIEAGHNKGDAAAVAATSATVSSTTPSAAVSGLAAATGYSYAEVQTNANGTSNIVTGTFATSVPSAILSSPTPTGALSSSTTANLGATTNQSNGTLHVVVDTPRISQVSPQRRSAPERITPARPLSPRALQMSVRSRRVQAFRG